jgi:hypothetical protein
VEQQYLAALASDQSFPLTTESKWPLSLCSHFHPSGLCLSVTAVSWKSSCLGQAPPQGPRQPPGDHLPSSHPHLPSPLSGKLPGRLSKLTQTSRVWCRAPLQAERASCSSPSWPPGGAVAYGREGLGASQPHLVARPGHPNPEPNLPRLPLPRGSKEAVSSIALKQQANVCLFHCLKWELTPRSLQVAILRCPSRVLWMILLPIPLRQRHQTMGYRDGHPFPNIPHCSASGSTESYSVPPVMDKGETTWSKRG